MNKGELIEKVAKSAGTTKKQAGEAVNTVFETITKELKRGRSVTLVGFGTFSRASRKARTGRNPRTGEAIKIKARKVARFKPGKGLSEALN